MWDFFFVEQGIETRINVCMNGNKQKILINVGLQSNYFEEM